MSCQWETNTTHSHYGGRHRTQGGRKGTSETEEGLAFALKVGGGVGTWDWDVPGDKVYANARFVELYSLDPERAASGAPISEFISALHADDRSCE